MIVWHWLKPAWPARLRAWVSGKGRMEITPNGDDDEPPTEQLVRHDL